MRFAPFLRLSMALAMIFTGAGAIGQIAQKRPELCGSNGFVPVPNNLVVRNSKLLLTSGTSKDFEIDIENGTVPQVCTLSNERLLVFIEASQGGSIEVLILNTRTSAILERFRTFNPSVSPNGRWLIYHVFYAHRPDSSDEYLLYDLTKSPEENTMPDRKENWEHLRGRVVYPAVAEGKPFNNVGLPKSQRHSCSSIDFFWSQDSTAFAFSDAMMTGTSFIMVTVGDTPPKAFVFPLLKQGIKYIAFTRMDLNLESRILIAHYKESYGPTEEAITVHLDDFKPAPFEIHPEIIPMESIQVYSKPKE